MIEKKLHDEIKAYCKLNNIKFGVYVNELLQNAFNIDRYGISPFQQQTHKVEDEFTVHEKKRDRYYETKIDNAQIIETKKEDNNITLTTIKSKKRKLK